MDQFTAWGQYSGDCKEVEKIKVGIRLLPLREHAGGDAYVVKQTPDKVLLAVIDGLGHGSRAHVASQKAVNILLSENSTDLEHLLRSMHTALRDTVGVVAGVVIIDFKLARLTYTGVGNITIKLCGRKSSCFLLPEGILGYGLIRPFYKEVAIVGNEVLIMHTDGIKDNYKLDEAAKASPWSFAQILAEDYRRPDDDALVLVANELMSEGLQGDSF